MLNGSIRVGDGKPDLHPFVVAIPKSVNRSQQFGDHECACRSVVHPTAHTTCRIFKTIERHVIKHRDTSIDILLIDKSRQDRNRPHGKKKMFSANDEGADAGWVAPRLDV